MAGKSAKGKQSQTQPKELDPGAYPGKESVGFLCKAHPRSCMLHSAHMARHMVLEASDQQLPVPSQQSWGKIL